VQAGVEPANRGADSSVDRELVAARVDAELERAGQAEPLDREPDHGEVLLELCGELFHIADVVDALVEPAAELGRDRLGGDSLVGNRGQDHQQFDRRLRRIRLIH